MGYARYTGQWVRSQQYEDPDRFTVESPPDPAHGQLDVDMGPNVMMTAPILQDGGELIFDGVLETYQHLSSGQRIDNTPIDGQGTVADRGHGYGGTTVPLSADEPSSNRLAFPGYGRGFLGALRGRDLGAKDRQTSQFGRPYNFYNEQWFGLTTEGMDAPPITQGEGDDILRRGLNAYPENDGSSGRPRAWTVNVPSWKRGTYSQSNVNRDFSPPNRTHGQVHMVQPDIVTIIGDAPPPDQSDKYATPWSSLRKFQPKTRRISGIRRVPGPWDENIIANSPEPTAYENANVDGMVVP